MVNDAVLSVALDKLSKFAASRISLIIGVHSSAESIREELVYMKRLLRDIQSGMQVPDNRLQQWLTDMTDIANDTVTVLEDFTESQKGTGCLGRVRFYCSCWTATKLANQIQSIRRRVDVLGKRRENYGISTNTAGTSYQQRSCEQAVSAMRKIMSCVGGGMMAVDQFVGLHDAKRELLQELLKEDRRRCVVSIHGLGGLGKTSLARTLYNSPSVCSRFPNRAWICVSQEYDIPGLLRSIIKSFNNGSSLEEIKMLEGMNEEELVLYLRGKVRQDDSYLLVVDDVWDRNAWECLKRALPDHENGSRVIVTTRKKDVATRMDCRVYAHHLRFLNQDESWELFSRKLSHAQQRGPSIGMEDLAREMVDRCRGLPLALIVLGGLLAQKQSLEDWLKVKQDIWRYVTQESIEIADHLLSLSFKELPFELSRCFLYMGVFPEDYLIDTETLMYMWMAEGLVPPGEDMEDIAESYLNELINRSLVQVAETFWGTITKARVHDLLRDFAMKKAAEADLFDICKSHVIQHKRRHIVHTQLEKYLSSSNSPNDKLRSLVVINYQKEPHDIVPLLSLFDRYNNLYVLKLQDVRLPPELPNNVVKNLRQLKLLGLLNTHASGLPPSIGMLKRLQTLQVLPIVPSWVELPPETSKLTNLRHLICRINGNANVGTLHKLRTLRSIQFLHWCAIETGKLVNLQELVIVEIYSQKDGISYTLEAISRLHMLDTLVLSTAHEQAFPPLDFLSSCQNLRKLWLKGKIENFPPAVKWPEKMTVLCLASSKLVEDPVPTLGKLPNLMRLDLNESHKSASMVFESESFPQLEILNLRNLPELSRMELSEDALPKIKKLYMNYCFACDSDSLPERLKSVLPGDGESKHLDTGDYSTTHWQW